MTQSHAISQRRALMQPLLDEIEQRRPLPGAVPLMLHVNLGERFSAQELSQIVLEDESLTATVLRLVNSPYCGFPRRITTIRDAVALLGARTVRAAGLAVGMMRTFPLRDSEVNGSQLWRFAIAVALLAETHARLQRAAIDDASTAGLLHNVGRIALAQLRPADLLVARSLSRSRGIHLLDAEREVLGYDDVSLGAALAERWDLPGELVAAIGDQRSSPGELERSGPLTRHVALARTFARTVRISDGIEEEPRPAPFFPVPHTTPALDRVLERLDGVEGLRLRAHAFVHTVLAS